MRGWSAALLISLSVGGCRGGQQSATGLFVTVDLGALTVDQIEFTVTGAMPGAVVVPPTMRPQSPGVPLRSPQTITIFLPDGLADSAVTCAAAGFTGGSPQGADAAATATLRRGALVQMTLALAPPGAKANGAGCGGAAECASGQCVEGVCCDSACDGLCVSCKAAGHEGTCSPAPAGTRSAGCVDQGAPSCGYDGSCDGGGGCRRYPPGTGCAPARCDASVFVPAAACDGRGTCVPAAPVDCAPFLCAASTGAASCRIACDGDGDCVPGKSCVTGSCGPRPKKLDGDGCLAGDDCRSGVCQDGVCCDRDCAGACVSCNQPEAPGTCRPVAAGRPDPHGTCPTSDVATCGLDGLCDGAGACARYPEATICNAPSCNSRTILVKRCNAQGSCVQANVDCTPWKCNPASSPLSCYTTCTANAQCAGGGGIACNVDAGVCE